MSIVDTGKIIRLRGNQPRRVVAELMNLSNHALYQIESGLVPNPKIETLKRIADFHRVTVDDLLL